MASLSDSSNLTGGSQQQEPRVFTIRPLVIKRERGCCSCPKMAKVTLLIVLVAIVALVAISAFADPQNDTSQPRSRARSKLSSVRKKKPTLPKPTTTMLPIIEEISVSTEIPEVLSSSAETGAAEIGSTKATTTQSIKAKKVSSRAQNNESPQVVGGAIPEGCGECDLDECTTPADNSCATGLVLDRCSCCHVCGVGEGHRCYNSSLSLSYNPDVGICGPGMSCLLRSDLDPSEPREALCECRDRRVVCGSDQNTYLSECRLSEALHSKPGLVIRAWSPCVSIPVITTPVENVTSPFGDDVSMSCEVRGFPAPVLHWEFLAEGSKSAPLTLPGDDSGIVIVVRGGPEQMMTTSWIQIIAVSPKRQGMYYCVANNAEGKAQSVAAVSVYKSSDGDDEDNQLF